MKGREKKSKAASMGQSDSMVKEGIFAGLRHIDIVFVVFWSVFFFVFDHALGPVHTGSDKARQAAIYLYVLYRTSDSSI